MRAHADAHHLQPKALAHVLGPGQDDGVRGSPTHGHGLGHAAAGLGRDEAQLVAADVQGAEGDGVAGVLVARDHVVGDGGRDEDDRAVPVAPQLAPGDLPAAREEGPAQAPPVEAVRVAPQGVVPRQQDHGRDQRAAVDPVPAFRVEGELIDGEEQLAGDGAEDPPLHGAADDGEQHDRAHKVQRLQEVLGEEGPHHQGRDQRHRHREDRRRHQ
mmetsp:Transcript_15542/g.49120  ORF Transcript_15542/g.49120 Transcript_15542/m.49120 type:complete len:214 (-) Transcript_15542:927-1568(-)